jgi:hypothetical protein
MGYQVIRQPGSDLFGVFSSITGTFVVWDASRAEVVDLFVDMAAERARVDAERVVGLVEEQFAMTWDEAAAQDREHGGEYSAEPEPEGATE